MRVFLGIVLGALLTVLLAYAYDHSGTRQAGVRPLVNWDVAAEHWQDLRAGVRDMANRVNASLTKHSS